MPGSNQYKTASKPSDAAGKVAYERTVARLSKIRKQVEEAPRTGSLKGKVCIITGVGSMKGIGRASALMYAREGAKHLYLGDLAGDNLPNLKSTINEKFPDVKVTTFQGDAADEDLIKSICEQAIKEEGRLDVFFANAGMATIGTIDQTPGKVWTNIMRVNSLSTYLAVRYGSAAMKVTSKDKPLSEGSIIMTASVAGIRSGAGSADYSASKAAVASLAQTASHQFGPDNIRVNALSPGLIETGMTIDTFDYARSRGTAGNIGQLSPLERYGIAEEIASVALFLATDAASYITGQNLAIDGGLSAKHSTRPGKLA
ncbi:NAD(P)-binding protein [Clavulina sp. PMI_390]|nr:NAD(P)-binding protein [Clavulina sp. PMI_390]